jgi:hypothetical protein
MTGVQVIAVNPTSFPSTTLRLYAGVPGPVELQAGAVTELPAQGPLQYNFAPGASANPLVPTGVIELQPTGPTP